MLFENSQSTSFRYIHDSLGLNYRMTEIQSKIGDIQLKKLPVWHQKRKENAYALANALKNCKNLRIPMPASSYEHAWYKFYAYLKPDALAEGWDRNRILFELNQEKIPVFSGSCSEIYLEKCMRKNNPQKPLLNARSLGNNSLMFLVHPTINKLSLELYISGILNVLNKAQR